MTFLVVILFCGYLQNDLILRRKSEWINSGDATLAEMLSKIEANWQKDVRLSVIDEDLIFWRGIGTVLPCNHLEKQSPAIVRPIYNFDSIAPLHLSWFLKKYEVEVIIGPFGFDQQL